MKTLRRLFGKLRLRVNEEKSAVARPEDRKFLGYSFWNLRGEVKRRVAPKAIKALKERIRQITRRNGGRSIRQVIAELRSYLVGWKNYFRLADTPGVLRDLDGWIGDGCERCNSSSGGAAPRCTASYVRGESPSA